MADRMKRNTRVGIVGTFIGRARAYAKETPGAVASVGVAAFLHALLFVYDCISGFAAFTAGDRSWTRLEAMRGVLTTSNGDYIAAAAEAVVAPGEYLLQAPFFLIGGPAAVVLFQIALALAGVFCVWRIGSELVGPKLATVAALIYAVLPQSLVFPHQFVTETAVATACIFFVGAAMQYLKSHRLPDAAIAGAWLGLAIFIRPSFAVILPALIALFLVFRVRALRGRTGGGIAMAAVALAPLMIWVAAFTATTGQVGYTNGVANLSWNLRSRVFLVQTRNGLPLAPEVARYKAYEELYGDNGGIGIGRFLEIASEAPVAFVRSAVVDEAIVFARGNLTKLTVDYLGLEVRPDIKQWRNVLSERGVGGLIQWSLANATTLGVFITEGVASLFTFALSIFALAAAIYLLARARKQLPTPNEAQIAFVLIALALIAATAISAVMVDSAQARLRHPSEAMIVLLCLIGFAVWRANTVAGQATGRDN